MKRAVKKFVQEIVRGESYRYYPLCQYVVAAPGVCGRRIGDGAG